MKEEIKRQQTHNNSPESRKIKVKNIYLYNIMKLCMSDIYFLDIDTTVDHSTRECKSRPRVCNFYEKTKERKRKKKFIAFSHLFWRSRLIRDPRRPRMKYCPIWLLFISSQIVIFFLLLLHLLISISPRFSPFLLMTACKKIYTGNTNHMSHQFHVNSSTSKTMNISRLWSYVHFEG